jgi:hypothetical protein
MVLMMMSREKYYYNHPGFAGRKMRLRKMKNLPQVALLKNDESRISL